ncbi:MAG TPA: amino acid adenylation domain-containing protein [Planctomycetota bacterium]|nr:amino acid adenylation domain-containing protein [Planctomycetota bacterium]
MALLLSHLLLDSARRSPDALALAEGDESLSYARLEGLASALARSLAGAGVEPGDRVAILLPRAVASTVAVHAALKAGASYVPVDPAFPPARAGLLVSRAGAKVAIGDAEALSALAGQREAVRFLQHVVVVSGIATSGVPWRSIPWPNSPDASRFLVEVDPDSPACVLFTSGSTGEPKGVVHSHASALAFTEWARETFELGPRDRVAASAPLPFDLSTFDLFSACAAGASVHFVPREALGFPVVLTRFLADRRASVWYSVPSILGNWARRGAIPEADLSTLRLLLFAGEVFPTRDLRALMRLLPRTPFHNLYGPTETNVATWYPVPAPPPEGDERPIPIGNACCGDEVRLAREDGNPCAPGEEGEIVVSGPTVMLGYWGRDPLPVDAGGRRRYATGDFGVEGPGGELHFRGRRDSQVKTRGHRVELGEVEAALLSLEGVGEACVVAVPDPQFGSLLAAFLVAGGESRPGRIAGELRERLPPYMVPERVLVLPALPRTPSGKIDRPALLARLDEPPARHPVRP